MNNNRQNNNNNNNNNNNERHLHKTLGQINKVSEMTDNVSDKYKVKMFA